MDAHNYPYIRDTVVINAYVQGFYNNFVGSGPVFLLGRVVIHEVDLIVGQKPLIIIADEYHGNGKIINARGAYPGGVAAPSLSGANDQPAPMSACLVATEPPA